jgi:hypothetical protein
LSEQARGDDLSLVDGLALISIRTDVNRVFLAIQLAHEAGLTMLHARADRDSIGSRLEHVRGADLDAAIATGATVADD